MAQQLWVVDPSRFAAKIISASGDPKEVRWKSNPAIVCPNCQYTMDNRKIAQQWPGLPKGVKFDPSDPEIIEHLLAKVGCGNKHPHPFIDEFITTIEGEDGICYTHPQNLPGVKKDGSATLFFHRAVKAYNTGKRKRRKIQGEDNGDLRWHKTGRTKPVILGRVQRGCKKIMVLYVSAARGGKLEKTNWVMHQYHLGTEEDEKDGEYVISKVFYQQQQLKQGDKSEPDHPGGINDTDAVTVKVDPVTPEPPRTEKRFPNSDREESISPFPQQPVMEYVEEETEPKSENYSSYKQPSVHNPSDQMVENDANNFQQPVTEYVEEETEPKSENYSSYKQPSLHNPSDQMVENDANNFQDSSKWWSGESQELLDSQQLVDGLYICDELLQSQSPDRDGNLREGASKGKPRLSDYAHLGAEHLKKDLEECQNVVVVDPADIYVDTPPDFRFSQLEFGSQDSFIS